MSITAPAREALLSIYTPEFAFACSDAGIGVDANTLALTLDEEPLAVRCDHGAAKATGTPTEALAEGPHILAGAIADFHGQLSLPSRVRFTVDTVAPLAASVDDTTVSDPKEGNVTIAGQTAAVKSGAWVTITNTRTGKSVTVKAGADGSFSAELSGKIEDPFQIPISDLAENASESQACWTRGPAASALPKSRFFPVGSLSTPERRRGRPSPGGHHAL